MLQANPPGRPLELNEAIIQRILEAVPKVIIPSQVAALSRVPKQTLSRWLINGKRDSNNGISSLFAQLWDSFTEEQAKVAAETITKLRKCPKNYGALTFILEKCFKDDFESKSDVQKQLEDYVYNVIKPLLSKGELRDGLQETKERASQTEAEEI